jgi:ribose 5-phosphate isomerase A
MTDRQQQAKEAAGRRAAEYVESGMRVGLGTGSTVEHTLIALGERQPDILCAATSERTARLGTELGLKIVPPDELGSLDIAIDGADEVDPELHVIKGGGGAHTREKIIAQMAARFLVVVDESKLVRQLGAFGLPLEVLPFAPGVLAARLRALGARAITRREQFSDNGNLLLDADFGLIDDPEGLAAALAALPGLVEHGLFLGNMVERVIVAGSDGTREIARTG